jgi:cytochrome c-type biogenesis protein CcmF
MGAWLAHAGFGLVVIAIAGAAWTHTATRELKRGDQVRIDGYTLTFTDVTRKRAPTAMQTRAIFDVQRGGRDLGQMRSGRDFYPASGELSNEVAIRHNWRLAHDLFISIDRITEDGVVTAKIFVNPLVPLLWLGGIVIVLGALLAALPGPARMFSRGRTDSNGGSRVGVDPDALHELRNGAAAPGELLSGVRGTARRPEP